MTQKKKSSKTNAKSVKATKKDLSKQKTMNDLKKLEEFTHDYLKETLKFAKNHPKKYDKIEERALRIAHLYDEIEEFIKDAHA